MKKPSQEALDIARSCSMSGVADPAVARELQDLIDERDRWRKEANFDQARARAAEKIAASALARADRRLQRVEAAERKLQELVQRVRAYQTGDSKTRLSDLLDEYEAKP